MNDRIRLLIDQLGLKPHPEGGHYREVFRSEKRVIPGDRRTYRNALTGIYYLLQAGQFSRWHCVLSDEIWCHLEGDPLEVFCLGAGAAEVKVLILGAPDTKGAAPMHAVSAGVWQAAKPKGGYALAGCFVGPGFDFQDFRLAADDPEMAKIIRAKGREYGMYL